jgi:AcrR family transcriptional regulator
VRRRTQAERRAETRARLLASARRAFARDGYHATSLERVSENAGCTKGAVYDHFGSKAGLFLALLDAQFATRIEQAQHADHQPPSKSMPFDREFATRLHELRSHTTARVGEPRLAAALGAAANGASIEALIFGEPEGAATFDMILTSLLRAPP